MARIVQPQRISKKPENQTEMGSIDATGTISAAISCHITADYVKVGTATVSHFRLIALGLPSLTGNFR